MGGIVDGAALARGGSRKRRRDTEYIYPQSTVRSGGGSEALPGGGIGGIADGAALVRGGACKPRRDTEYIYPQSTVRGGGGRGGIADGEALACGGACKPRRDFIYPQSTVRVDGGRGNIKDVVIPDDTAAVARGEGWNRKRWSDKQPFVSGTRAGSITDVLIPNDTASLALGEGSNRKWSRDSATQPFVSGTGIGLDDCGGGSNLKRRSGDGTRECTDTKNIADPDLIGSALKTLPAPPQLMISLEEEDVDQDDPVYLALHWRGIEPDSRYQPYMDLYLYSQPQPTDWNEVWKSLPLKLHDAGLVAAVDSMIQWGPGMKKGILNLSSNITRILKSHPGPVSCLRIDSTELPGLERMEQWMDILTEKLVEELILVNINTAMDFELPLHHLRSPNLKRLCVGFASICSCLRLAFGADKEEPHCWASLTELNLISCGFNGSDLSYTVRDLFGLKSLTIGHSNLTVGCDSKGLILASMSLVSICLWDCTAETSVTVGRAPALKYLTVDVKALNAPSLLITIDICEDLRNLDRVALHQQDIRLCTGYETKIQRKKSISLPYLHTLTIAAQLARADNTMPLLRLLHWFPNLTSLTVWRVDSDNGDDEEFPSLDSVACLCNELEQFTLRDFRGGRGDVTLLLSVLDVARKLKSLLVYSHRSMPQTPDEATEFFRSSPRLSQNCAIVVFAPLVE